MTKRTFNIRYGNWPIKKAEVDAKLLDGDTMNVVRRAMGHAFPEQLKGEWKDHADCAVVLEKDNPGVWVGRRDYPTSKQKSEPFYILEV